MRCSITWLVLMTVGLALSLYEQRKAGEFQRDVRWWLKMTSNAIAFTGEFIVICIQCKVLGKLFLKWRNFNKMIYVHNAPEKEGIVHQQQETVFSVDAQLTASVLNYKDTKQFSTNEDELHRCHNGSSNSVSVDDRKSKSGNLRTAEKGSSKTFLTSIESSGLVPVGDHCHPLSEVVVTFTATDTLSSIGEEIPPDSPIKQPAEKVLQIDDKN